MRNTFLVCYDICDDRRLAKVHKTMRGTKAANVLALDGEISADDCPRPH